MWNQNTIQKAWNFASEVHKGQTVPGSEISYLNHIGNVAFEAMASTSDADNPELLILCAILQDSIEDTDTTYDQLSELFGKPVADGVLALSKNESLPTKAEQMADSLKRIKDQPREIAMVKLCDRITNLQKPPHYWTEEKKRYYREEAQLILEGLGFSSEILRERMKVKIAEYGQYI